MSHQYDNLRPLLRDQASRPRPYRRPTSVIPLHPHLHDSRLWRAVGFSFLAIATALLFAAILVVAWRSGNDFLGHLVPGWPLW